MRKSAPIEVVVHYPKTKEGWDELGKRVATAHANYVIEKIDRLNCPTWQKLELLQAGDRYYQRNLQTQRTPKARLAAEPINKAPRSTYAFLLRPETVRFRGSVERGAFCVT